MSTCPYRTISYLKDRRHRRLIQEDRCLRKGRSARDRWCKDISMVEVKKKSRPCAYDSDGRFVT